MARSGEGVMAPNAIFPTHNPFDGMYSSWSGPYRAGPQARPHSTPARPQTRVFRPIELAAAAGVALLLDITTWGDGPAPGGFGLAVLFALLPGLAFLSVRAWRGSIRLAIISGLLAVVVVRCALDPTVGVILSGLALVSALTLALRVRRISIPDLALAFLIGQLKIPSRINAAFAGAKKIAARTRLGQVSVLPIVVPAGLVAVFLGIFALANPLVAHGLSAAWSALASLVTLPSFGRIVFWTFSLAFGVALLRPAYKASRRAEIATTEGEASQTSLSIARNALVGLNVVFLAYNALDATYLWSGSPPAGMRTQQYAHQGAFWLTVALVLLTAVIGVMFRGTLAHDVRAHASRRLAYVWMGQGLVLALGTYRRIAIHIAKSGLSDLRIVGILGTSLVVCGVVLVALKLRGGKTFTWLLRRQLDAFALTAIVYTIAPTHLVSASVNVARVSSGEYRPILHAFRQSHETESATALVPLLHHSDLRIRQGVAALLKDEHARLRGEVEGQRSWRQRDVATSRALATLDAAEGDITTALGTADPMQARKVLLEISRVANEDRSLEELLAIPAASDPMGRSDVVQ